MRTMILLISILILSSCSSHKTTTQMEDTKNTAEVNKHMIEAGYLKGTIVAEESESNCPYVIRVEADSPYFLDPTNLEQAFKKDGEKVWFKFTGLRMMNRCDKANPIRLDEIHKRS